MRGYLGLHARNVPLPRNLASRFDLTQTGAVEVMAIEPGGPADQAGILEEDLLVTLGDQPTTCVDDLHKLLTQLPIDVPASITLAAPRSPAESPGIADGLSDAGVNELLILADFRVADRVQEVLRIGGVEDEFAANTDLSRACNCVSYPPASRPAQSPSFPAARSTSSRSDTR